MDYWWFDGNRDSFAFRVSESGHSEINGTATSQKVSTDSYYNPTGRNEAQIKPWYDEKVRFDENLSRLELVWSIHPSNATEADISPADLCEPTLYERCKTDPESSHVFITYYDSTDDYEIPIKDRTKAVGINIVLPKATFEKVWMLFNRILSEPNMGYIVTVDFGGWIAKRLGDESDYLVGKYKDSYLTMDEFLNGNKYYSNEVKFSVGRYKNIIEEKEDLLEQDTLPSKEIPTTQNELPTTLSTIKSSLRWITFLLIVIAAILIFK